MDEINKKLDKLTEYMDTQVTNIAQEFTDLKEYMASNFVTKEDLTRLSETTVTKEEYRKGYGKLDEIMGELKAVR